MAEYRAPITQDLLEHRVRKLHRKGELRKSRLLETFQVPERVDCIWVPVVLLSKEQRKERLHLTIKWKKGAKHTWSIED